MRTLPLLLCLLIVGCQKPMTREEQIKAYKTCQDAGKKAGILRGVGGQIEDVECEP